MQRDEPVSTRSRRKPTSSRPTAGRVALSSRSKHFSAAAPEPNSLRQAAGRACSRWRFHRVIVARATGVALAVTRHGSPALDCRGFQDRRDDLQFAAGIIRRQYPRSRRKTVARAAAGRSAQQLEHCSEPALHRRRPSDAPGTGCSPPVDFIATLPTVQPAPSTAAMEQAVRKFVRLSRQSVAATPPTSRMAEASRPGPRVNRSS